MSYFDGCRGKVFHEAWLPDGDVRSAIVFTHGYGEHLGLYDALARRLSADGHAFYAFDQVGHGRSDGPRAIIESWDDLVDDARTLARLAGESHPGAPLVLMGHSGGALATFLVAARHPELASAAVISGAPLLHVDWVEAELSGAAESDEVRDLSPAELLSTHPDYVHALMNDPLVHQGGFMRETLQALLRAWPEVTAHLEQGRPGLPVLMVNGAEDQIVPAEVMHAVAAQLPNVTTRVFDGDKHDVLNEHDRDDVHDVIAAWLDATLNVVAVAQAS